MGLPGGESKEEEESRLRKERKGDSQGVASQIQRKQEMRIFRKVKKPRGKMSMTRNRLN